MYSKQFRVAKFTRMDEGDADDYALEREAFENSTTVRDLPVRLLDHLKLLAGHTYGHHIDRLTHCLQAATRAQEDGRDDQYVAMALLHDIGDVLSPLGHEEIAAGSWRLMSAKSFSGSSATTRFSRAGITGISTGRAATASRATNSATIRISRRRPSSAKNTTRSRSTRSIAACRSRHSKRRSSGFSRCP